MKLATLLLLLLSVGWTTNLVSVKGPGYPYPCVKLVKDLNLNESSVETDYITYAEYGTKKVAVFKDAFYFSATAAS